MVTYICLGKWTQQGIEGVKDSPKRLDAARESFRAMGAELKDFYMTTGRYDIVFVVEAPDDATVVRAMLNQVSKGGIRTETLRAFPEAEYREILGKLT